MLDVHAPHESVHTWRDFFIHIATICVGLLIAIGLEQTVEAIHRHQERHRLVEAMQVEARKNSGYLHIVLHDDLTYAHWFHQVAQMIKAAQPVDGKITITLPAPPDQTPHATASRSVWSVARASGKVALLPDEQAEAYDRVDFDAGIALHAEQNLSDGTVKFAALLLQLNVPTKAAGPITVPAAQQADLVSEMDELSILSSQAAEAAYPWLAGSDAIADGIHTQEEIWPYLRKESYLLGQ